MSCYFFEAPSLASMRACVIIYPVSLYLLQDFPFSLDAGTGRLALKFDEGAAAVTSEDIKISQRAELVPWLIGLPRTLFDHTVSARNMLRCCCCCMGCMGCIGCVAAVISWILCRWFPLESSGRTTTSVFD